MRDAGSGPTCAPTPSPPPAAIKVNHNAPGAAGAREARRKARPSSGCATTSPRAGDEHQGHRPLPAQPDEIAQLDEGDRRSDEARDPKHLGDFVAILALFVRRDRRVVLHPPEPAAAVPAPRGEAVPAQGRLLDRPGGHAGPGPDRARLRRAHRRHLQGRARERPRDHHDGRSTASTRASCARTGPALLRPKTGLKDMFIELIPGKDAGAAGRRGLDACRSPRRCPTSTRTSSSPRSTRDTRDYLKLLLNGAARGLDGPRRRPQRRCSSASSRPTATSPRSRARWPSAARTSSGSCAR